MMKEGVSKADIKCLKGKGCSKILPHFSVFSPSLGASEFAPKAL